MTKLILEQNKEKTKFEKIITQNVEQDINKRKKVIIITNSRISALLVAELLRKNTPKIKPYPLFGKKYLCLKSTPEEFYDGICEQLFCPLKTKTKKTSYQTKKSTFYVILKNKTRKLKKILEEKQLCPFYFQIQAAKFANPIITTKGFLNQKGIQFIINLTNTTIHNHVFYLINPTNLLLPSKINIPINFLQQFMRYAPLEIQNELEILLETPKNTLMPLPIDPLFTYTIRQIVLQIQNETIKKQFIHSGIYELSNVIEYEQPYLFKTNNEIIITDASKYDFIKKISSIFEIKSFTHSDTLISKIFPTKKINLLQHMIQENNSIKRFYLVKLSQQYYSINDLDLRKNILNQIERISNNKKSIIMYPNNELRDLLLPNNEIINTEKEETKIIMELENKTRKLEQLKIVSNSKEHHTLALNPDIDLSKYNQIIQLNLFSVNLEKWEKQVIKIWEKQNGYAIQKHLEKLLKNSSLFYTMLIYEKTTNATLYIMDNEFEWIEPDIQKYFRKTNIRTIINNSRIII